MPDPTADRILSSQRPGETTPIELTVDLPDELRKHVASLRASPGNRSMVIATGHQPTLWHPGILAKDLAADVLAKRLGGRAVHVRVEHNPVGAIGVDWPVLEGEALSVQRVALDDRPAAAQMSVNRLQPIDTARAAHRLSDAASRAAWPWLADGLKRIAVAFAASEPGEQAGEHLGEHLGEQVGRVVAGLRGPMVAEPMGVRSADDVVSAAFVERLLADPVGCVRCYNRAALAYPEARVRPLHVGREVVEVPLWWQGGGAVEPVYADLGDSRRRELFAGSRVIAHGTAQGLASLRPRAITLSALMRAEQCDVFIHGRGGGVYDRVTDRWWRDWLGQALVPAAVVSADVRLPLEVPTTGRASRDRAVWLAHHLPKNVDRWVDLTDGYERSLADEKRGLLDRMADDRDRRRRAKAFARVQAINDELARRHRDRLARVRLDAEQAGVRLANSAIAARRDWCFGLYPSALLGVLRECIEQALSDALG